MNKDHHRELVLLPSPIRPVDIKTQAVFRGVSENRQIQWQEALAYFDTLRTCWSWVISQDEGARTRCVRLWCIETILARGILAIFDAQERFDAVLVSAAIGHVVVKFHCRVTASVLSTIGRNPGSGEKERQRQVAEHPEQPCVRLLVL